jgi:hypothetical protein
MPAGVACAVLLAGTCVQAPYDRATELLAMYSYSNGDGVPHPQVQKRLGVRIVAAQTDDLIARDTAGTARACRGDACVLYVKTCSADGRECEYDWGRAWPPGPGNLNGAIFYNVVLWIKATSAEAMSRATAALSVVAGPDESPVFVPVAAMNVASRLEYWPPCAAGTKDHPSQDPPGCVNLFYGRAPDADLTRDQRLHLRGP